MASVTNPAGTWKYSYNGEGMRTSETSPLGVEYFTWNTESSVPQLLMDGSNAYIYGPQGTALGTAPVEQISLSAPNSQSSVTYLLSDPQGVRLTFNSSGTITAGATYSAYGQVTSGGLSSITLFGYAGGYTDPTGLIYLVNRYYDPSTGQFLSVDPLVGITDQPYQYAGGDPVNFIDPLGLSWCSWSPVGCGTAINIQHKIVRATKDIGHAIHTVAHFVVKHKVAIGEIAVGALFIAGATVLTAGVVDALVVAGAGATEESVAAGAEFAATGSVGSFLGAMSPIDLAIHAPFVFAPGITLGLLGFGSVDIGIHGLINGQYDYQNNSVCKS